MNFKIPRTLDRPARCVGIPVDSIIVAVSIYSTFVCFEYGSIGIPCAIFCSYTFAKYRSRHLIRNILRFVYWYLPSELTSIEGVPGHQRTLKIGRGA